MMRALAIAIGNPLRRDDGVAHHVLESLDATADIEKQSVQQLTPELAEQIRSYDTVIFVDAHANAKYPMIQPVNKVFAPMPLTHVASAAELVAVARALFGFSGNAYMCRVPASDFSEGEGLSERSRGFVRQAAREIEHIIGA
jgi:hydrogenase maturation protease